MDNFYTVYKLFIKNFNEYKKIDSVAKDFVISRMIKINNEQRPQNEYKRINN